MSEWTKHAVEVKTTWHPMGYSYWRGPVRYEQRVNGQPTGMSFTVSRWRYWWIWLLARAAAVPILGRAARRYLRTMTVEYRWTWYGKRGQA